jgi:hypothetical protein
MTTTTDIRRYNDFSLNPVWNNYENQMFQGRFFHLGKNSLCDDYENQRRVRRTTEKIGN